MRVCNPRVPGVSLGKDVQLKLSNYEYVNYVYEA